MSENVTNVSINKKGNIDVFKTRLKEKRQDKSYSQKQLAEEIGVDRATISYYEKGDRLPDIDTFINIADALQVSCDYLLGYSDTPIREYHDVQKITGLSDKAIRTLEKEALEVKKDIRRRLLT